MFQVYQAGTVYGKCPKILYTKMSDKMHMQTVQTQIRLLLVWSGSTLFAVPLSILRNNYTKNKN